MLRRSGARRTTCPACGGGSCGSAAMSALLLEVCRRWCGARRRPGRSRRRCAAACRPVRWPGTCGGRWRALAGRSAWLAAAGAAADPGGVQALAGALDDQLALDLAIGFEPVSTCKCRVRKPFLSLPVELEPSRQATAKLCLNEVLTEQTRSASCGIACCRSRRRLRPGSVRSNIFLTYSESYRESRRPSIAMEKPLTCVSDLDQPNCAALPAGLRPPGAAGGPQGRGRKAKIPLSPGTSSGKSSAAARRRSRRSCRRSRAEKTVGDNMQVKEVRVGDGGDRFILLLQPGPGRTRRRGPRKADRPARGGSRRLGRAEPDRACPD